MCYDSYMVDSTKPGPNNGAHSQTGPQDQFILGTRDGEKYPAMPLGQVHIVAGASGSGKTTWLFQLVRAILDGRPFFGYPTANHKMAYVVYDRSAEETEITMARAGITPENVPIVALKVVKPAINEVDRRFENDMRLVRNAAPDAKVLIIDGFYTLVPHGHTNDYLTVAEWLQRVRLYCAEHDLTIIGVTHSPKQREGNKVIDPRQMIHGSVAGGGFTSCGVVLIRERATNENRELYILPRNAPEQRLLVGMDKNGLLDPAAYTAQSDLGRPRSSKHDTFDEMVFATYGPGQTFTTGDLQVRAAEFGISRMSVSNWLGELVEGGFVEKLERGKYAIPGVAQGATMREDS